MTQDLHDRYPDEAALWVEMQQTAMQWQIVVRDRILAECGNDENAAASLIADLTCQFYLNLIIVHFINFAPDNTNPEKLAYLVRKVLRIMASTAAGPQLEANIRKTLTGLIHVGSNSQGADNGTTH